MDITTYKNKMMEFLKDSNVDERDTFMREVFFTGRAIIDKDGKVIKTVPNKLKIKPARDINNLLNE